jgi:putative transcriptional regulator
MSDVANSIRRGVEDAIAYARGDQSRGKATVVRVPEHVDVKALRARLGLSQAAFAARYGFSVAAVRDWEQGRRRPEASARVLLTVIDREPEAVERALSAA